MPALRSSLSEAGCPCHSDRDFLSVCTREEALKRGWSGVWFSAGYGLINTIPDLLNTSCLSILDDERSGAAVDLPRVD